MRKRLQAGFITLALLFSTLARPADDGIPASLREWQGWVLHGEEYRACPFRPMEGLSPGQTIPEMVFHCQWPERLTLSVDSRGGTFSQRWQVFAESWVQLPGDAAHWPRDVRLNGVPAPVVGHEDRPSLRLRPGNYTISGRFEWTSRPEALPLPDETAIVDLFVDGSRVPQPERPDGGLWLGKRRSAQQAAAMEVQVYRLVRDEIPVYLITRLRLNVAGEAREEQLGKALPDGFTPVSLRGDLPARLERDGSLRVQVRPGSHEVTLMARGDDVASTLARPDSGSAQWPKEEIWSFAANDLLRVATAAGPEGIDPAQAGVPGEWRQFPAFRMDAGAQLTVEERSRGLANVDDNRLTLNRSMWLDFDHAGFTVMDRIGGEMRRDWRLDMHAPFSLQSARQQGDQLLVTEGADGRAGVELRQPQLDLTTVARKISGSGAMPATGWDGRFDQVSGVLYLPPGHRLLAALGTDHAPSSWWERWGLWDVFGVLLIVGFVYWTAGLVPALVAALALMLTYQEMPEFIWLWGNLLAALSVARAAPEGRFRRFANLYRTLSFAALGLALLPFLWLQVRYALYPQLINNASGYASSGHATAYEVPPLEAEIVTGPISDAPMQAMEVDTAAEPADAAAAAAVDADVMPPALEMPVPKASSNFQSRRALNRQMVVQRYAPGTVLQAGPGVPGWNFNAYSYSWSGPVTDEDTVRFLYIGPVWMFFWRLLGVIGLVTLFAWLAMLSFGKKLALPAMPRSAAAAVPMLAPLLLALCLLGVATPGAAAGDEPASPGSQILEQLHDRLTGAPACSPQCADITSGRVVVDGDRLEVTLQVSALANVSVAMPQANDRWQLDEVVLDARNTLALMRRADATLWVPMTPGAHTVRLAGRLAPVESIQLAFALPPRVIDVTARGWTISGVNEGRLVSGSLEFARERDAGRDSGGALEAGAEFPAFVKVERVFNLDLDWTLETTVTRLAPQRAALSLEIPLITGESVLTPEVKVRDNAAALVGLNAGQNSLSWVSGLARANTLEIALPADAARAEVWSFLVNPQWNVEFDGFAAVLPEDVNGRTWMFRYVPRPGEKLTLKVSRPQGVKGTTLAVDSVRQVTRIGRRLTATELQFNYRSTQGGRHVIKLPADARVSSVSFDDRPQQLRPEKGELPLSLAPGSHAFEIRWDESRDVSLRSQPSTVDLGTPASNLTLAVELTDSRWILAAWGPGIGPAVLYWGELVVFIAVAWFLGRWPQSPLKFIEWLLLGLGLSTQSWFVFALTAAWLLVMRWREGWQPGEMPRWRYNAVQVVLAAFTLIAIVTLVFSGIRNGLLAQPDMHIAAAYSPGGGGFAWFVDQTRGAIEGPTVISVPMWVYRGLFFAWALWMAFALVRWLRWAFKAWKSGGLWRGEMEPGAEGAA